MDLYIGDEGGSGGNEPEYPKKIPRNQPRKGIMRRKNRPFLSTILYFLQLFCPSGISPVGNLGCLPRGKPAATESRYPTYGACWVFLCFHNPPNSDVGYGIFNVRTDVNARNCTHGRTDTDTVRESALKVESRRKIPCRTRESNRVGDVPVRCSSN